MRRDRAVSDRERPAETTRLSLFSAFFELRKQETSMWSQERETESNPLWLLAIPHRLRGTPVAEFPVVCMAMLACKSFTLCCAHERERERSCLSRVARHTVSSGFLHRGALHPPSFFACCTKLFNSMMSESVDTLFCGVPSSSVVCCGLCIRGDCQGLSRVAVSFFIGPLFCWRCRSHAPSLSSGVRVAEC
jgi:hypothetical protein